MNENQMNHNKQGSAMHEPKERGLLSVNHAGLLASAAAGHALDTCTIAAAAMVSLFGHGDRQGCAHPKLQDKSTVLHRKARQEHNYLLLKYSSL